MAKISIGNAYGSSTLKLSASLPKGSQLELQVGDGHDMSVREIEIIERDRAVVDKALEEMSQAVERAAASSPDPQAAARLKLEAEKFSADAEKAIRQKRWFSLSAKGLLEAATLFGGAATPILTSAVKVVELFQKIRGG